MNLVPYTLNRHPTSPWPEGGNDHEIFESPKTIGHTVTSPEDTRRQVTEAILNKL